MWICIRALSAAFFVCFSESLLHTIVCSGLGMDGACYCSVVLMLSILWQCQHKAAESLALLLHWLLNVAWWSVLNKWWSCSSITCSSALKEKRGEKKSAFHFCVPSGVAPAAFVYGSLLFQVETAICTLPSFLCLTPPLPACLAHSNPHPSTPSSLQISSCISGEQTAVCWSVSRAQADFAEACGRCLVLIQIMGRNSWTTGFPFWASWNNWELLQLLFFDFSSLKNVKQSKMCITWQDPSSF